MNFPDALLPSNLAWAANAFMLIVLFYCLRKAPWHRLKDTDLQNVFLGSIVTLMLIWSIKTGIKPGLNFHMLGATLLTLMFGPWLALIGLFIILLLITISGHAGWETLGLNYLLMAGLPVWFSHQLYKLADSKLPNHFFIYVLVNSFFGAAIAIAFCGICATFILATSGAYSSDYLFDNYLIYYILMGWSEAFLTGMAITLMAVYRPKWLCTFDDARYLKY